MDLGEAQEVVLRETVAIENGGSVRVREPLAVGVEGGGSKVDVGLDEQLAIDRLRGRAQSAPDASQEHEAGQQARPQEARRGIGVRAAV